MSERDAFLREAGFGSADVMPLPGDASFRRYFRITGGPEAAMLMEAPPQREDCRPFVAIAEHLSSLGFSAPKILARDLAHGFLLLEDLGDDLYARVIAPENETALYEAAIDALIALRRPVPERLGTYDLPRYIPRELHRESDLLIDWYLSVPEKARNEYRALWADLWPLARSGPEILVLRDYHAENLFWLPQRGGTARVGLIDFQDGLIGDAAYDLVSLLEDARRDVAPDLANAMIARYVAGTGVDEETFRCAYDVLAAQRNAKIVGIFARLDKRDGKPRYLSLIPRVMAHLKRDVARQPAMAGLRDWLDRHMPEDRWHK